MSDSSVELHEKKQPQPEDATENCIKTLIIPVEESIQESTREVVGSSSAESKNGDAPLSSTTAAPPHRRKMAPPSRTPQQAIYHQQMQAQHQSQFQQYSQAQPSSFQYAYGAGGYAVPVSSSPQHTSPMAVPAGSFQQPMAFGYAPAPAGYAYMPNGQASAWPMVYPTQSDQASPPQWVPVMGSLVYPPPPDQLSPQQWNPVQVGSPWSPHGAFVYAIDGDDGTRGRDDQVIHHPGPPIQMVPDGHGPDGCNLFVFHIPNEMSNLDLFNSFSPFGNVISARIMVDNDSGRSRGFGFVSFDNPESADEAILQMNGLQIGKKRLKVQHKKDKGSFGAGYGPDPPKYSPKSASPGTSPHGPLRARGLKGLFLDSPREAAQDEDEDEDEGNDEEQDEDDCGNFRDAAGSPESEVKALMAKLDLNKPKEQAKAVEVGSGEQRPK